ncbi:cbb3-type cytochrome c oxidase subunit 3 [Rhodovulum adriaticum]|uniref:Cytochrome c oxidase cbb3-type subunit 4 n=2 Tax=Rhodovulum adriaticum TaxID=35804 RepID=A0A4R2P0B0_RHOAD|nr:cbb3-type cytochrome c oxidase subunit 3 [Rhodovulum adriaticum]MBK1636105.1 CcoQ/FixQ family Cbb3-type cytochrome c oxidase assembly chaperone [Rhodovulum adriaticum]TCP27488.1 cytochrome c oxidase cbb3-type subunit 4 [Rhodovulum adriaticum]
METYSAMREFADSWALLALTLFFLGVIAWVFRPGSTREYRDTADIPFRHDDEPAPRDQSDDEGAACHKEART